VTAPRRGLGGSVFLGAVTIEPFEVSRWRGGCGTVYGIWMGMCLDRRCFCVRSGADRGKAMDGMRKSSAGGRRRGHYVRGVGVKLA
jgi:hypothetical protein